MKAKACGILLLVVGLMILAMPMRALAHDHDGDGWRGHDRGRHNGWYKHHGGDYGWYEGRGWRHHHDHDGDRWYGRYGYGYRGWDGYQNPGYYGVYPDPGYYGVYPGGVVPPIAEPWSSAYPYPDNYAAGNSSLMLLRQTMNQRYNANQALYQAAMAQGNYSLANKAQARMQLQSATINQTDAMMNGAASPVYPGYNQPIYGADPYAYGQTGYSPPSSLARMIAY